MSHLYMVTGPPGYVYLTRTVGPDWASDENFVAAVRLEEGRRIVAIANGPAEGRMKAVLLDSSDGQEFAMVILTEKEPDLDELQALIERVQRADDDWTWDEHMIGALQDAGYTIPELIRGPQWD